MRHVRGSKPTLISHNKYPVNPKADGRGASTITRKTPFGKDPLAVGEGKPSTHPRDDKESA